MTVTEMPDLGAALEGALTDHEGAPVTVTALERRPCAYRTSYVLEELDVTLADGRTLRVMFKDLSRACLGPDALLVKPASLHDPAREIEVYRDLLDGADLGTPAFYGASVDPDADRWWLFVENVEGPVLWQVGEFHVWEAAARWLAQLHGTLAAAAAQPPGSLLRYGPDVYRVWIERARRFAERQAPPWTDEIRAAVLDLHRRYDPVVERLSALPATIVHGEFYPSNVLVQHDAERVRIAPIDWEVAGAGPGVLDLAALTMGKWTPAERDAMVKVYRAALSDSAADIVPGDFDDALNSARLHLAVQGLARHPEAQVPAEHRHNWLEEALQVAGELRL